MENIMKIVKALEESGLPIKKNSETIKNEAEKTTKKQKQKGGSIGMLSGTLAVSLLGTVLTGWGVITASEGVIRAGQNF